MTKLLLVDDSESNRLVLGGLLEDEGLEVDVADSFAQGRAMLREAIAAYDVVLLDQHLGDGLGTELVPLVRAAMPHTKILMISGSGAEDGVAVGIDVDGVLTKGEDFVVLLDAIERLAPRGAAQ
jgi:DNA-binding response OmpR family regulator